MGNGVNKRTMRVAFCSIISALSLAMMMLTAVVPVGTYALPCAAGIIFTAVVVEYGAKWAFSVYLVVAILSTFLSGDKEAVIYFVMIFGYYPILKSIIESKIKSKALQYLLKFLLFNSAAVASFFIGNFLIAIPPEEYMIAGVYVPWVLLIIGNIFFVIYDLAISMLVVRYVMVIHNKIFKRK